MMRRFDVGRHLPASAARWVCLARTLLPRGQVAYSAAPPGLFGLWINQILPEDLRHFAAIKPPTKAITVTVWRTGTSAVKRQRVGVKGDFSVAHWSTRDPMAVGIIGDSTRTIVNTSWAGGHFEAGVSSHVYTLEDGKWRNLYRCCKKPQ